MKMRYQFLIGLLLLSLCVLSGCSDDYIPIGTGSGSPSCPIDFTCFDISNSLSNPYNYNVSSSLDEPYNLDSRG